jgi:hypothetical protein
VPQGPVVIPGIVPGNPGVVPGAVIVLLGAGTANSGLTPPPSSSVAPSGIAPPLRVDETPPGLDSGEAVPLEESPPDVVQLEIAPIVPVGPLVPIAPAVPVNPVAPVDPAVASPPPSKEEPMPVVGDSPVIPADPEDPVCASPQLSPGVVLKPPGLIPVAPSGKPVGLLPVGAMVPGVPRGEVPPSAGGVVVASPGMPVVVCANTDPQLNTSAAAIIDHRRILASSVLGSSEG